MLVVGQQGRGGDIKVTEELGGVPRVLCKDSVGGLENLQGSECDVVQVACWFVTKEEERWSLSGNKWGVIEREFTHSVRTSNSLRYTVKGTLTNRRRHQVQPWIEGLWLNEVRRSTNRC